jgi:hypothetical protein
MKTIGRTANVWRHILSGGQRDILDVLRFELEFLEHGGYERSVRTPWNPASIFHDSLSCINFNNPEQPHPCSECLLNDFVPGRAQAQTPPCHYIPLNEKGETIKALEQQQSGIGCAPRSSASSSSARSRRRRQQSKFAQP